MTAAADYPPQTIRRDPETGASAIRLRDDVFGMPSGAWGVMTVDRGGDYRSADQVADWPVVFDPRDDPGETSE